MKIVKVNKKVLNEATKKFPLVEAEGENAAAVITDPDDASLKAIAAAAEAGLEAEAEAEGETINITDKNAIETAKDIKDVAKKIDAQAYVATISDNILVRTLDKVLRATDAEREEASILGIRPKSKYNVVVSGLPGSGKTAIVKDWASARGLNLVYVDAKYDDLEAFINGFPLRDASLPNKNRITKGVSDGLAALEEPRSVLFLDELNRQTKSQIRASLLTLINEHSITGDKDNPEDVGGYHYFKNLLFTIACINPALPTEKGVTDLDDAELSRFGYKIDFDSNPETAYDFFSKVFDDQVRGFKNRFKNGQITKDVLIKLATKYLQEKDLGITIVTHPNFAFDGREDLDDVQNYGAGDKYTLFNMRMLYDGIKSSGGDPREFLDWVNYYSNFRPAVKKMLQEILRNYTSPVIDPKDILADLDIEEEETVEEIPAETPETEEEEDLYSLDQTLAGIDDSLETDTSLFAGNNGSSKKVAVSPAEVQNRINNAF